MRADYGLDFDQFLSMFLGTDEMTFAILLKTL